MHEGWRRIRRLSALIACGAAFAIAPSTAGAAWVQDALDDQYELGADVPFANATFVGTHNSFNSIAEMGPTLSALDANQRMRITRQLDAGIRSIELDLHWILPLNPPRLKNAVVVCHGRGPEEFNLGCTIEKRFERVLRPIAAWLRTPANSDEALLIYLEDDMGSVLAAHDSAAAILAEELGDLVYQPAGAGCTALPISTLTREQVLASGAQVVLVSGCGTGAAWQGQVFNWSGHEEARPFGYQDYPGCGPDFTRAQYDGNLIRYYEDTTFLTNGVGPIPGAGTRDQRLTPATTAAMMRCGVDLTGFDKLTALDPRLDAAVWSWAPGQPRAGRDCAVQKRGASAAEARWYARDCAKSKRPVCRDGASWLTGPTRIPAASAEAECAALGAVHAVPRTGYEAQLLREAMLSAEVSGAWLGYRRSGTGWVALDSL